MSETPVYKAVMNGLSETLTNNGGGMPTGEFVLVAEVLNEDGISCIYVAGPESQATHRSQGLLQYGREFYDTEARLQIMSALGEEEEE